MLNTHNIQSIMQELAKACQEIGTKYGVTLTVKDGKYTPTSFTCFIEGDTESAQTRFEKYASLLGLKAEHFHKTIKLEGQIYKIVDIKPTARKNNVIIENLRGKTYVTSVDTVLLHLTDNASVPGIKRPEAEIIRDIQNVYTGLSPENLSCDGELPLSKVQARRKELTAQLLSLFSEIGREVNESEAYSLR